MLSRKFNIIILLVYVLFVSAIKSSINVFPPVLTLIVNCNKINSYTSECGSSFEDSCNNIVDAVKYFNEYYNSKPENIYYTLVLKSVDGTYSSKVNYIHSGLGLHITISTYTTNSQGVIIDESDLQNTLFDYFNKGVNPPSTKTYLKVSNVAFVNFFSLDYDILNSDNTYGKMETQYIFDKCKILNSTNLRFSGYGESNEVNSISFEGSTFEKIDSKIIIINCTFNQVSYGPIGSTPAFLIKISNGVKFSGIILNTFNNFDGVLVESNKASILIGSNTFSNSNNKPIIKSLNSTVLINYNTFNYSGNSNDDQLIDCTGSSISFSSNTVCSNSQTTTTSSFITTTGETTHTFTTGYDRPNGSVDGKSESYQLLVIILIIISLSNI
ncbi:hypothetical protein ACTFIY_004866 [Dictyostelium cf. discoideum]